LSAIARKVYGDANRWQVIYDANKDAIGPDPGRIFPGQRLVIP
jgi:nucleoid-associated protein YgaU